jgi:hypothetical protein
MTPQLRELEEEAREAHAAAMHLSRSFTSGAAGRGGGAGGGLTGPPPDGPGMPHSRSAAANLGSVGAGGAAAVAAAPAAAAGGAAAKPSPSPRPQSNDPFKQIGNHVASAMGLTGLVDSVSSSSEGLKSLVQGAWADVLGGRQRESSGGGGGGGESGGGAAPAPAAGPGPSGGGGGGKGGGHRASGSFSASMDPSGFTLIENYAQAPPAGAAAGAAAAVASHPIGASADSLGSSGAPDSPSRGGGGGAAAAAGLPDWLRGTPLGGGLAALNNLQTLGAELVTVAGSGIFGLPAVPDDVVPDGEEPEDEAVSEVYEHERVQPFRGWGHSWPGHFLPSDRVGHWGDRWGRPGGPMSMLFEKVVPRLPGGWEWTEDEWRVDMTGAQEEGVDAEGWSYSMDFRCGGVWGGGALGV